MIEFSRRYESALGWGDLNPVDDGRAQPLLNPTAIVLSLSPNIAAAGATSTTALMTPPAGKTTADFSAGRIQDDTNPAVAIDHAANKYSEYEWCIQLITAATSLGQIYEFRMVLSDGTVLDTYSATPQLTVGTYAPPPFLQNVSRERRSPRTVYRRRIMYR